MSFDIIRDARVWFAGGEITGDLNAVALGRSKQLVEATTLGKTGIVRKAGLDSVAFQMEGYVGDADALIAGTLGVTDIPVSIAPGVANGIAPGAEGGLVYSFRAIEGEYTAGGRIGEMYRFSAGAQSSAGEPLVRGVILHNGTRTITATGTARGIAGVLATERVYAALHVTSGSGGTLTVSIQSDAAEAFGTPTTVLTFAPATGAGSQWLSAPGLIPDAWWRPSWTISGGSFDFIVTLGIR